MFVLVFPDLDLCGMVQRMSTHWDTLPSSGEAAGREGMAWCVARGWDSFGTGGLPGHV